MRKRKLKHVLRPLFKVSTSLTSHLSSSSNSLSLPSIRSPRTQPTTSLRIGCPTGAIIHIPRKVAVLRENLSSEDIKHAFNIEELIDLEASSKEAFLPDIRNFASNLLEKIELPIKSFSKVKLAPRQFTLLTPIESSDSEEMQLRVINNARRTGRSHQSSPKALKTRHDHTFTKPDFSFNLPLKSPTRYVTLEAKEFIGVAKGGNANEVLSLLTKNRKLIEATDSLNCTALHWAVKRNHLEVAKILIHEGSNLEVKDISGRTPIEIAANKGYKELVQEMMKPSQISKKERLFRPNL